jgi:hypothetical protein
MYVIYVASLSDKKDDLTVQRKMVWLYKERWSNFTKKDGLTLQRKMIWSWLQRKMVWLYKER